MRLLVTGGAGFIGSHYVRSVLTGAWGLAEPDAVTVLDKLTYAGTLANLDDARGDERLTLVQGDVCDRDTVDALMKDADAVVHCAAESHVDRSIAHSSDFVLTNVVGTQTMLESAMRQGLARFVHVSTDEVYGSIDEGACDEEQPLRPSSPYSASKASADLLAQAYVRTYGLPVSVTRGSNTYGPRQHPEKLIPLFLTNLIDGQQVPLYGDGSNVRDWLHVDDHCRGIHLVLTQGRAGETYNLGGGTSLANRELTGLLLAALGLGEDWIRHVEDRPGHDQRYCVDSTKARVELGYRPQVPFDEGLAQTVAWYRAHRGWWAPLKV